MKALLVILVTAMALASTGIASAERYTKGDGEFFARASQSPTQRNLSPDDMILRRPDPLPTVVRVSMSSFDWEAATIGAVSGFGIALVLLGGSLMVQRRIATT